MSSGLIENLPYPRVIIRGINYKWADEIPLGVRLTLQIAGIWISAGFVMEKRENINHLRFEECEACQAHIN